MTKRRAEVLFVALIMAAPVHAIATVVDPSIQAVVIDGIAAVVAGDPIFLSDVRDAERWRLFEPDGTLATVSARDPEEPSSLARLIDRRLVLGEIARYAPLRPSQAEIDAALAQWRARTAGLSLDASIVDPVATAFITDSLRIERYVEQRFTAAAQPTREEAGAWYEANRDALAGAGLTGSFDDVEQAVRARLAEERRLTMVRTWLDDLRTRVQVRVVRWR